MKRITTFLFALLLFAGIFPCQVLAAESLVSTVIEGESLNLKVTGIDTADKSQMLSVCVIRSEALDDPDAEDIVYANTVYANGKSTLELTIDLGDIDVYSYHLLVHDKTGKIAYKEPLAERTALTVTGASLETKTYDGKTDGKVTGVTFAETSELALSTDYTATVVYDSAGAGERTATVTVVLKDTEKTRAYKLSNASYELAGQVIQPRELTLNVEVADKKYDGKNTAAITKAELTGVVDGDTVTLNSSGVTAAFDSAEIGSGIGITFTGDFLLEGEDAGNYKLTQPSGITANITKSETSGNQGSSDGNKNTSSGSSGSSSGTKASGSNTTGTAGVATGDSSNVELWTVVIALSGAGILAAVFYSRKKNKES